MESEKANRYLLVGEEPELLESVLERPLNLSLEKLSKTDPEAFRILQVANEIGDRIKTRKRGEA